MLTFCDNGNPPIINTLGECDNIFSVITLHSLHNTVTILLYLVRKKDKINKKNIKKPNQK